jgi:hypothetical protein
MDVLTAAAPVFAVVLRRAEPVSSRTSASGPLHAGLRIARRTYTECDWAQGMATQGCHRSAVRFSVMNLKRSNIRRLSTWLAPVLFQRPVSDRVAGRDRRPRLLRILATRYLSAHSL